MKQALKNGRGVGGGVGWGGSGNFEYREVVRLRPPFPLPFGTVHVEHLQNIFFSLALENCTNSKKYIKMIFPRFFQLLIRTSYRTSIDTTGKSILKLVNLGSLKVICQK